MSRLLLAFATAATACTSAAPDLSTAGGMVDAYVAALCPRAHACRAAYPQNTFLPFEEVFGTSAEACTDRFVFEPRSGIDASVDAGRVTYHPKDGDVCLSSIANATCDALFGEAPLDLELRLPSLGGCTTTFTPTVREGGACATTLDCIGELECDAGVCTNT